MEIPRDLDYCHHCRAKIEGDITVAGNISFLTLWGEYIVIGVICNICHR